MFKKKPLCSSVLSESELAVTARAPRRGLGLSGWARATWSESDCLSPIYYVLSKLAMA